MAIIYPRGLGGWYGYPGDDDDDYDDSMYGAGPMNFGGPRGESRSWFPGYGMYPPPYRPFADYYRMGGRSFYQSWPPMSDKDEKKGGDDDKKKKDWHHHPGPSGKKSFFLVRPKSSNWKGYCDHMPGKKNGIKASPPIFYLFT